ncbi:MAG TPA: alpha/beta hydrolase [Marmoricola sp.]|nr:alpha/beta hydrolase [Marmoricola sp.]
MHIVMVPGLWLDASSWDAVVPALQQAGHVAHPLTLPGMESKDADRTGVTLRDWVDTVVAAIDSAPEPVLLVCHSAGSGVGHAALDARPDRVTRAVHVGGFPPSDGSPLLSGLPAENGEVPMPDWVEMGERANVTDFDEESLARFYTAAIPVPETVLAGPVELTDERRYDVPVTAVCPEYTATDLRSWVESGDVPELARIKEVDYVDLPGGHWPQLTQPEQLARVILDAAGTSGPA